MLIGSIIVAPGLMGSPAQAESDPAAPVFATQQEMLRAGVLKTTRKSISYKGTEKPGTIIIDTEDRSLLLITTNGRAYLYKIGVGRPGFEWRGTHAISRKSEWPDWYPPEEMRQRQPYLPARMEGGPQNPLGARAIYLGSTLYRIHGTNEAWTIGSAMSSGCFRMLNDDVVDLYERVEIGAKVIVK